MVDMGVDWAQDLKLGYCNTNLMLSKSMCCKDSSHNGGCTR